MIRLQFGATLLVTLVLASCRGTEDAGPATGSGRSGLPSFESRDGALDVADGTYRFTLGRHTVGNMTEEAEEADGRRLALGETIDTLVVTLPVSAMARLREGLAFTSLPDEAEVVWRHELRNPLGHRDLSTR